MSLHLIHFHCLCFPLAHYLLISCLLTLHHQMKQWKGMKKYIYKHNNSEMKMKMLSFYSFGLRSQSIGKVNIHSWCIERCDDIVACHWRERLSAQNYKVQPAGKANHTAIWKPLTAICLRAISLIATELQVDQRLKNPTKYVCHFFDSSVVCCSGDEGIAQYHLW